jgi:ribosomal protein S18 acetylase RimI-like enzyme
VTPDARPSPVDPRPRYDFGHLSRRCERGDDAPFRLQLFYESHGAMFAGFDPALVAILVQQQMTAQAMACAAHHMNARCDIVEHDGTPIGRMVVDQTIKRFTLVDIALLAAWRGQGFGNYLLGEMLREAAAARVPVHLSVALDNPARRLYARLGFATVTATATHAAMRWDAPASCS